MFIGGKSMGGRMATHLGAAHLEGLAGIIVFGYPLHPPGKPAQLRVQHLPSIAVPVLIVQGERDAFGSPQELKPAIETMTAQVTLHAVAKGDHSLAVGGRPRDEILNEVLDVAVSLDSCGVRPRPKMRREELGWDQSLERAFQEWAGKADVQPGRVLIEFNYICRVWCDGAEIDAVRTGRMSHRATSRSELPVVGDWVVVRKRPDEERGAIVAVLPRRSWFSRRMAGQVTDEQVVAANVDVVFTVMALDADFSPRRLERYLLLARESGASPVVLLTKPDVCDDVPARVAEVTAVTGDAPVHVISPKLDQNLDLVAGYLPAGKTGALLGSSGVGKSTIINRLVGRDVQKTRDIRTSDSKGRHTTTHRELVFLPNGGFLIDTPGMRELQLWDVNEAVSETFDDIEALAPECRFTDCRHRDEPRCAVKAAVEEGNVSAARLESYLKLQDELGYLARQQDERAQLEEKRRNKIMGKALKQHLKTKRG